ncbi:hypothetical protein [Proteus hauseri]|uniref:hypothetical protein n=1 Tax=Proteus hauseri TaxID=183417 RepID=UPI0032DA0557
MAQNDGSLEEINAALTKAVKGTHPEGQDPALGILIAWGNLTGIPLDVFLTQQEMTPEKAAEILSSTPPTTEAKTLQFVAAKVYLVFAKSGQSVPNPSVTSPKGNNSGAGSNWTTDKNGAFSPKNDGTVTTVGKGDGNFDGNSLPYDKAPIINPATNKVVTEHIVRPSGKAPDKAKPNSIIEISRADGSKSITYYDQRGNAFSREDYGQQSAHKQIGIGKDGRAEPHEHKYEYNDKGLPIGKYYRKIDQNGKPIGEWINDKKKINNR